MAAATVMCARVCN